MTFSCKINVQILVPTLVGLCLVIVEPLAAQPGRGGFGKYHPMDRTNPFRVISQTEAQTDLKLTPEQIEGIEKIETELEAAEGEKPKISFPRTDEEREALQSTFDKKNDASLKKLAAILKPEQLARLGQLQTQALGVQALSTKEVTKELDLSEEQNSELSKLLEDYRNARYSGRREDREKTLAELNEKILGVLSSEQQDAWQKKLGPPLAEKQADASPAKPAPATPVTTAPSTRGTYTPPKENGPVVVSLDVAESKPEASGEKPTTPKTSSPANSIQFHLENAPWELVLNQFARKANLTPDILDIPPGSITYTNDQKSYTPTEALDILHGYLLQKGFVMIKRDRFLVVLSIDKRPIPPNLIPNISIAELERGEFGKHELLNVVLPLEGAEANDAAREVELLKGPQGTVVPLAVSNSLVVTDTYSNLNRIHALLKGVTSKADPEEMLFKSIPLKHVVAAEAEVIVRDQLGLGTGVTNVSASTYDRSRYSSSSSYSSRSSSSSSRSTTPPDPAKVTADPRTNSLLITATKNQLAIAEQVLMTIDISEEDLPNPLARGLGIPYLRVYRVNNADAREVTKTLDSIMPGVVINEDGRGGTIHVKATERQHEEVAKLISQLDGGGTQAVGVIPLSQLDPIGAAATLRSLFSSDGDAAPVIEADSYGKRLMIRGSADQLAQVKLLLSQLGEDGSGTGPQNQDRGPLRTIPLGGRDAEEFVRILEQVWGRKSETPVRVVIPSSNPIRDRVIPSLQDQSRYLLPGDLQPATENRPRSENVDPRSTSLRNKPLYPISVAEESNEEPAQAESKPESTAQAPAENAPATLRITKSGEMIWNGESINPTQLSIRLTKWADETPESARKLIISTHPETPTARSFPVLSIVARLGIAPTLAVSADDASQTTQPSTKQPESSKANSQSPGDSQASLTSKTGGLPITMTVRGGDLMLFDPSGKSDKLDEMELVIEQLALAIPPRTTWTVYYLRSAEVTETATMLEQLFPSSSVSSGLSTEDGSFFGGLTNSLSSLGNSLVDAAGLNSLAQSPGVLRIVPEIRSNSLYVSGPADQVRQVEQMLRVLDADELPETLKDRIPRMIPVEYANVNEVANIVKEVYHDLLEDSSQRQARANPLEMMMGGGRSSGSSRNGGRQASTARMTIGVDAQTSKLVVSASDSLYRQVQDMVADLDEAAFEARRTVQVVSVGEANSAVLQQAISALLPNVSVSTTSSSSRGGTSSSSNQNSSSASDDARRAAFFEQMRRSQQDQSDGGSPRSSGGSFPSGGGRPSFGGGGSTSGRSGFFGGSSGGSSRGGSSSGRSSRGR